MPIWIFRISTLVAFPFLTYNFIDKDWMSLLGGLLCSAIVLAGEVLFKRLRLIKIMIACTGLLLGYMLYVFFDYGLMKFANNTVADFWGNYEANIEIALLVFGVLVSIFKARDFLPRQPFEGGRFIRPVGRAHCGFVRNQLFIRHYCIACVCDGRTQQNGGQ